MMRFCQAILNHTLSKVFERSKTTSLLPQPKNTPYEGKKKQRFRKPLWWPTPMRIFLTLARKKDKKRLDSSSLWLRIVPLWKMVEQFIPILLLLRAIWLYLLSSHFDYWFGLFWFDGFVATCLFCGEGRRDLCLSSFHVLHLVDNGLGKLTKTISGW